MGRRGIQSWGWRVLEGWAVMWGRGRGRVSGVEVPMGCAVMYLRPISPLASVISVGALLPALGPRALSAALRQCTLPPPSPSCLWSPPELVRYWSGGGGLCSPGLTGQRAFRAQSGSAAFGTPAFCLIRSLLASLAEEELPLPAPLSPLLFFGWLEAVCSSVYGWGQGVRRHPSLTFALSPQVVELPFGAQGRSPEQPSQ